MSDIGVTDTKKDKIRVIIPPPEIKAVVDKTAAYVCSPLCYYWKSGLNSLTEFPLNTKVF